MMMLSILIGIAHLVLANAITAWRKRGSLACLGPIGWILGLVGGFLLGAAIQGPASDSVGSAGTVMLISAGALILLFTSERPVTSARDWVGRMVDGLKALTDVSKAFGDVLSYLRLFALGLASAQLAVTFNNLAGDAAAIPGAGMLLAIVIVVAGHAVNFLLATMSGVVHGLRLNCIEFFNWSLQDEGQPFRPFARKAGS